MLSKEQIKAMVRKQRNEDLVKYWHEQCDQGINDPSTSTHCLSALIQMRPMYDCVLKVQV